MVQIVNEGEGQESTLVSYNQSRLISNNKYSFSFLIIGVLILTESSFFPTFWGGLKWILIFDPALLFFFG